MKRRQRHETNTASNGLVGAFEGSAATIPTATAHRATRPKPCGHSVLIMLCARCWNGGHWPLRHAVYVACGWSHAERQAEHTCRANCSDRFLGDDGVGDDAPPGASEAPCAFSRSLPWPVAH